MKTPRISERVDISTIDVSRFPQVNDASEEYAQALRKMISWGFIEPDGFAHSSKELVSRADAAIMMYDVIWK